MHCPVAGRCVCVLAAGIGFLPPNFYVEGNCMSLIQISDLSFSYDGSYEPIFEHDRAFCANVATKIISL